MQIFRYWERVDVDESGQPTPPPGVIAAAGWSDESPQAARAHAMERARRFLRLLHEQPDQLLSRYQYANAIREPVLDEMQSDGVRTAALTRNAYGAVILNAARMFIADIDNPRQPLGRQIASLWNRFRGHKTPSPQEQVLDRVRQVVEAHGSLGVRVYRTAGGYRVIATNALHDPQSEQSRQLLQALGSDPLYVRLCDQQGCYRARLTPKPWRIGLSVAMSRPFPPANAATEREMRDWVMTYESACRGWGVCELVETIGEQSVHPAITPILAWHDLAIAPRGAKLA